MKLKSVSLQRYHTRIPSWLTSQASSVGGKGELKTIFKASASFSCDGGVLTRPAQLEGNCSKPSSRPPCLFFMCRSGWRNARMLLMITSSDAWRARLFRGYSTKLISHSFSAFGADQSSWQSLNTRMYPSWPWVFIVRFTHLFSNTPRAYSILCGVGIEKWISAWRGGMNKHT